MSNSREIVLTLFLPDIFTMYNFTKIFLIKMFELKKNGGFLDFWINIPIFFMKFLVFGFCF